jgi:cellulose synthase/poly-beta-1,6-N-acetylglucosamine synthase-like glycosyltransferase
MGRHSAPDLGRSQNFDAEQAAGVAALTGLRPSGIAVVIPARDEGADIEAALYSVASQTLPPDQVLVVVNNSTDDTAGQARRVARQLWPLPVRVLEMPGVNPFRKAGALNYGLRQLAGAGVLLPQSIIRFVLTMDGDTELEAHFCERAARVMERDPRLGGVSAACLGKPEVTGTTAWQRALVFFQRVEYSRFTVTRLRRNVHTMSGAGAFYRAEALNDLYEARGQVFEQRETNLVEDYETTLALKRAGWRVTANQACIAYTDLMTSMRALLAQRTRWVRGTVDEWRRYGWCRETRASIAGMAATVAGLLYTLAWASWSAREIGLHGWHPDPRYLVLAAFWSLYQGASVRHMGWRTVLVEAALLPELAFGAVRYWWLARSVVASYRRTGRAWS